MSFKSMFTKMETSYSEEDLLVKIIQTDTPKGIFRAQDFIKQNLDYLLDIEFPLETLESVKEEEEFHLKFHEIAWKETVKQAKRHFKKKFKKGILCMIMPTKELKEEIYKTGIETIPYNYFFVGA
jgi:hypothetical protein